MRGTLAMKVGRTSTRLSLILAIPSENQVAQPARIGAQAISRPSTWASGTNRYCISVARMSMARTALHTPAVKLRWVSTTPLGVPVVPEV